MGLKRIWRLTSDEADTLIEVVAASAILGLIAVTVVTVVKTSLLAASASDIRAEAVQAQEYIASQIQVQPVTNRSAYIQNTLVANIGKPLRQIFPDATPTFPQNLYLSVVAPQPPAYQSSGSVTDPYIAQLTGHYSTLSQYQVVMTPAEQQLFVTLYWRSP